MLNFQYMDPLDRERGQGNFVGAAKDELEFIDQQISDAEAMVSELGSSDLPAAAAWRRMVDNARKRRELFIAEHDQAGAFKLKKFDRQIRDFFFANDREGRKQVIEQDAVGMYHLAEGQEDRRLMFVDMLELARLNKEGGGHEAGDAALEAAVEAIKETVQIRRGDKVESPKPFRFDIFRSGGNQFMLSFDGISAEEFDAIADDLAGRTVGVEEKIGRKVEAAPLVVSKMEFKDLIEDLNVMQSVTGDLFKPGADAARELMAALLKGAEWRGDVGKFVKYAERLAEKFGSSEDEAKTYFNEYVKKYFAGTRFETLEGAKALIEGGELDKAVREEALSYVREKFDKDRMLGDAELDHLDKGMRGVVMAERAKARWRGSKTGEYPIVSEQMDTEQRPTPGETILQDKKKALAAAEAAFRAAGKQHGLGSVEEEARRLAVDNAKLDLDIEAARRNLGTGLLERGEYYKDLEAALEEGRGVTAVFADMGFLKYFDEDGGKDVGDRALLTAARLMERALDETGLKGEVYRYGGDEFTVLLDGTKADAEKFRRKLSEIKKESGVIPPGRKSKPSYVATELQFNIGVADRADLDDITAASGRRGASLNKQAEIMTKTADVAVEYGKAIDRIDYLIDALRNLPRGTITPDLRAKLDRSAKAIEPDRGGETLIRTFADELQLSERLPDAEREIVLQEIAERSASYVINSVEAKHAKDKDQKQLVDRFIEAKTKADFLETQIGRLRASKQADAATIKSLSKRLEAAQAELEGMRSVRSRLAA